MVEHRTGRELEPLLRELYVDKRHTQDEIAEALGVHRITVLKWLQDFGVTRPERRDVAL